MSHRVIQVINLYFRRGDGAVPNENSRLCSCHFKDGLRENGPSIFSRNIEKVMLFPSPEKKRFVLPVLSDYLYFGVNTKTLSVSGYRPGYDVKLHSVLPCMQTLVCQRLVHGNSWL